MQGATGLSFIEGSRGTFSYNSSYKKIQLFFCDAKTCERKETQSSVFLCLLCIIEFFYFIIFIYFMEG